MTSTKHTKHRRTVPVSVRLTDDERCKLNSEADAKGLSLGEYIRMRLFGGELGDYVHANRLSAEDRQKLLAKILLRLGQLDTVQSVNNALKGIQSGLIDPSPEFLAALDAMHGELIALRRDLLRALGLRP